MKFGLREMILLMVLLAVPLSTFFLVFRPRNLEIAEAKKDIGIKRELLDQLRQATSQSDDLAKENSQIEQSIEAIEARLPTNKEVARVIRQVSDLALDAGLEPPQLTMDKPVKAALYMEQPLKMSIGGNFHGFYDFMINLEQLPRITRVPDMKITRSDAVDGHMKAEFTLSIYFQEEEGFQ